MNLDRLAVVSQPHEFPPFSAGPFLPFLAHRLLCLKVWVGFRPWLLRRAFALPDLRSEVRVP